ncbi:hypothetical protein ACJVC5_07240 [Peredibacter sp. HCB2-198]|uniref:hypothetical protein n=1 Tax=Peredibacter sp. HCB2-198 TaxID=3383025 RepID=UPI0038B48D4D
MKLLITFLFLMSSALSMAAVETGVILKCDEIGKKFYAIVTKDGKQTIGMEDEEGLRRIGGELAIAGNGRIDVIYIHQDFGKLMLMRGRGGHWLGNLNMRRTIDCFQVYE